jgi:glycerophosphoryl diester phosphodiesterase
VTLVLAHRGAHRRAAENTIPAFAQAIAIGADGVELDVRRSRDEALVVSHDAAVGSGVLCDLSWAEIRRSHPEIPTLAEALDTCAGALVNVEIKNSPHDPDWDPHHAAAHLLVSLLDARGHADRVLVSSFNLATVDRVRALDPDVPTALLTVGVDPLQALSTVASRGHAALHPNVGSMADSAEVIVTSAHEHGIQVNVWTVDDDDEIRRLAAAGVDGIVTDIPDVALRVLREPRS